MSEEAAAPGFWGIVMSVVQTWGPVIGAGSWPGWLVWKNLTETVDKKRERKGVADDKMTKAMFDKDAALATQAATMFDRMEKELDRLTVRVTQLQSALWAAEQSLGEYKANLAEARTVIAALQRRLAEDPKPAPAPPQA